MGKESFQTSHLFHKLKLFASLLHRSFRAELLMTIKVEDEGGIDAETTKNLLETEPVPRSSRQRVLKRRFFNDDFINLLSSNKHWKH